MKAASHQGNVSWGGGFAETEGREQREEETVLNQRSSPHSRCPTKRWLIWGWVRLSRRQATKVMAPRPSSLQEDGGSE